VPFYAFRVELWKAVQLGSIADCKHEWRHFAYLLDIDVCSVLVLHIRTEWNDFQKKVQGDSKKPSRSKTLKDASHDGSYLVAGKMLKHANRVGEIKARQWEVRTIDG